MMRALRGVVLALAVLFASVAWSAPARADAPRVTLYTIGPGSYLFSLYGHSVLCVGDACFDYGIATHNDPFALVWHALRGVPDFEPVVVDRGLVLSAFGSEDRVIDEQDVPLDDAARAKLLARLERDVTTHAGYAYDPWFQNCTTHLRDALDEASGGRLARAARIEPARTFRELSEAGFSGQPLPLAALALAVGRGDRVGTPFERMFLPAGLEAGVASAFGVAPHRVRNRTGVVLPTSVHAGRAALVVVAALLALVAWLGGRKSPRVRTTTLALVALVLAGAGLLVWSLALVARYPEVTANWNVLVVMPLDVAIPFLAARSSRALRSYVLARVGLVALVALASVGGVVAQPLVATALFAALPLAAIGFRSRA